MFYPLLITAALEEPDFPFMRHVEDTARRICVLITSIHHKRRTAYSFTVEGGIEQAHALYEAIDIPDGYDVCIDFRACLE